MNCAAVIPSLNPDKKLLNVTDGLIAAGFGRIYIVNDGSGSEYDAIFEEISKKEGCVVLTHAINKGKGAALKTAFEQYVLDSGGFDGIVTVDADGQHSPEDAARVAKAMLENPNTLVIGSRDFSQSHIPKKSALGNKITRTVFRFVCGLPINDTQSGLRGIPNSFIKPLLHVKGNRYEYETNMLLETKYAGIGIKEIPIDTIYINNNETSHFRPVWDSIRIYFIIIKFAFSSLASSVVDIALFALFNYMLAAALPPSQRLLVSTVAARLISALFNYIINKTVIFESRKKTVPSLFSYAVLSIVIMLSSYAGVYLFSVVLPLPTIPAKIIVDVSLFFFSFYAQRRWVF